MICHLSLSKVNETVDEVRRQEQRENKQLEKTRYIWLKNPENLTSKQQQSLKNLSTMNLKTGRVYRIKLSLKEFWDIHDITAAARYLRKLYF
ncbi:MAG: transposase [Thermosediminibacterales bacterium]|nr:transposase [Thermosediminibacterales bacterium]